MVKWIMTKQNQGMTLTEILIAMAILMILAVGLVGAMNPTAIFNRGRDARRKSDLERIRVAFEDYANDSPQGCYPNGELLASLQDGANCNSGVMSPWLTNWPCDPSGEPYKVAVPINRVTGLPEECPEWFKILASLEDQNDGDIPGGWYDVLGVTHIGDGEYTNEDVNYGVSSSNVSWYDMVYSAVCRYDLNNHAVDECYTMSQNGCGAAAGEPPAWAGTNCYANNQCDTRCKVTCCNSMCN